MSLLPSLFAQDLFDGQKLKEYLNPNVQLSAESFAATSLAPTTRVEGVDETKSEPNLTADDNDSDYNPELEMDLRGPYSAVATWTSAFNMTIKEAVGIAAKAFYAAPEASAIPNPNPFLPSEELAMDFVYGALDLNLQALFRHLINIICMYVCMY